MSRDLDAESLDQPTPSTLRAAIRDADLRTSDPISETFIFFEVACVSLFVFCILLFLKCNVRHKSHCFVLVFYSENAVFFSCRTYGITN